MSFRNSSRQFVTQWHDTTNSQRQLQEKLGKIERLGAEIQALYDSSILAGIKNRRQRLDAAKRIADIVVKASHQAFRNSARNNRANQIKAAVMKNVASQILGADWYTSTRTSTKTGTSDTYPEVNKLKSEDTGVSKYPDVPTCIKAVTALGVDLTTAENYCQQIIDPNTAGVDRSNTVGAGVKSASSERVMSDLAKIHTRLFGEQLRPVNYSSPVKRQTRIKGASTYSDKTPAWLKTRKATLTALAFRQ